MSVRLSTALVGCAVALGLAACQRLPQPAARGVPGTLAAESLTTTNTLPAGWGRLVTVTNPDWAPRTSLLWFEDSLGTVRGASYDHVARQFRPWVNVVPRTEGGAR
jgi:hypothetical protein